MNRTIERIVPRTTLTKLSPQCRKIVAHMERNGSISGDEAITYFRIMALPRRISDLEEAGIAIRRERRVHPTTQQHYVRYFLADAS